MKKFCFLAFFTISGLFIQAQSIVVSTNLWSNVISRESTGYLLTEKIRFTNDTTINFLSYKLVERTLDSSQVNWARYGFIREDAGKRVYYKLTADGPDMLLYALKLHIGDSVMAYGVNTLNSMVFMDSAMYHVTAIDSMLIGSNYRKQLHLSGDIGGTLMEAAQWIDSTGGMGGMLHNWNLKVGEDGYSLLCYEENGILQYHNPSPFYTHCYVTTGMDNPLKKECIISLSPNPANDKLVIQRKDNNSPGNIIIQDELGRTCFRENHFTRGTIDVSTFPEGIYFLRYSDEKTFSQTKFIIRR
jgi:hypothetical protein